MIRYKTAAEAAEAEQIIERSRFIAFVRPVSSKEEADAFFAEIRAMHRSATHNVPAFVIGDKMQLQWASDDGEPQGTAGAPIVQMLVKEGITNTAVMVTRYFGGIKLGTGGLVRAYTGSAKAALEAAGIAEVKERIIFEIRTAYSYLPKLQKVEGDRFRIEEISYADTVRIRVSADPEQRESVLTFLADLTAGSAEVLFEKEELAKVAVI